MAKAARVDTSREGTLRDWNKILGLWRVCDKPACRRGGACRGNVRACSPRNFALAPEGVQAWFACLLAAKEDGLSFDQAIAKLDGTRAKEAFNDWHAAVEPLGKTR